MMITKSVPNRKSNLYLARVYLSAAFLTVVALFCVSSTLFAQTEFEDSRALAQKLLDTPIDQSKEIIEKLSEEEAASVISQLRFMTRDRNPDLDKFVYLIEHLETIRATSLAQERLNKLLLVIAATTVLLAAFLGYTVYDQRRILRALSSLQQPPPKEKPSSIYRGDV